MLPLIVNGLSGENGPTGRNGQIAENVLTRQNDPTI